MALRSLVVMLKALPRRMPGPGALVPKGNSWSKNSARLTDPTKYGSVEETVMPKQYSVFVQRFRRDLEESEKQMRADLRNAQNALLITAVGISSLGFIISNA